MVGLHLAPCHRDSTVVKYISDEMIYMTPEATEDTLLYKAFLRECVCLCVFVCMHI